MSTALKLIEHAKYDIRLCVYIWGDHTGDLTSPVSRLTRALILKAQEGVKVRVITNDLEAVRRLRDYGIKLKIANDVRTMHTKAMVIDDKQMVLGSHNFSNSALTANMEASILTFDYEMIQQFITYFDILYKRYASSISNN